MLAHLEKFKHFLGLSEDDTSKDSLLTDMLEKAEERIGKMYFGGSLNRDTYEEYHRFSRILYPVHHPILNIIGLNVDGMKLEQNTDFYLINSQIIFTRGYPPESIVGIEYEAGFEVLPQDIETSIFLLAAKYLKIMQTVDFNKEISEIFDLDIDEILTPYKRVVV